MLGTLTNPFALEGDMTAGRIEKWRTATERTCNIEPPPPQAMNESSNCYCAICSGPLHDSAFRDARAGHEANIDWIKGVWVLKQEHTWSGWPIRTLVAGEGRHHGNNDWASNHRGYFGWQPSCRLYRDLDSSRPAFPFHQPCYQLLTLVLFGGDRDVSGQDLDALFTTMQSLTTYSAAHLELNYGFGEIDPRRRSYWAYEPKQDWLLSDPSRSEEVKGYLRAFLSSASLSRPRITSINLAAKIVQDLFAKLPFEIIHMVAWDFTLTDLLNLSRASWVVNVQLRDNQRLWGRILETEIIPFYLELRELEKEEDCLLERHHPKDLCVWIYSSTCPETGYETPVPGIANRRRIWQACLQFKDLHQRYVDSLAGHDTGPTRSSLTGFESVNLTYGHAYRTAWPFPQQAAVDDMERYQPLLRSWDTLAEARRHLVDVEWHTDETLDTIRVTPCLDEPGILPGDTFVDVKPQATEVPCGDWIRQLILHIPAFDPDRHKASSYTILPRGVTFAVKSGNELNFGETDNGHHMRPLVASCDEAVIIGLSCHLSMVRKELFAIASDEGEGSGDCNQQEPQAGVLELEQEHLARYLWKSDYRHLLGSVRIWDFPGLHLAFPVCNVFTWSSELDNPLPIALEALVWGTNPAHLGRFRRLSAWTSPGSPLIHTIRVDFAPADVQTRASSYPACQIIGTPDPVGVDGKWHTFDINTAAAEFITEVAICEGARHPCRAVRITSNWKEVVWGWPDGNFNRFIRAPAGGRLVSLVGVFGKPGWQHVQKGLNALAGLSMAT
ncbi:hypothetical protein PG993_011782 [Apiospora rasikravindrae]|uniref:F-box domain-containing protein n=1 Tax=Apiospora rasikravindrae TaxID=990691 RepID=A0ABR1S0L1_9PEZI